LREKLGVGVAWALYLGIARMAGREGFVFVIYMVVMALVVSLLIGALLRRT